MVGGTGSGECPAVGCRTLLLFLFFTVSVGNLETKRSEGGANAAYYARGRRANCIYC